ncbi:MAG: bifunctional hydroxymethylpyrimidine kinase/phosphomethylpyrimidine kinase [Deltaproteobacteria bacterium]|jgi:hydroxymethylpyrimidine/phosphomethylpyrimidine kinase|nr:bifunctional hydroxymethylpyrimidine kinase/phosphomethylpyrimidine kinase [Deltaproteobacteria bacterium]
MSDVPILPLTKALTIATSDSGGGAGIQADLKTFAAFGVFGLSVVSGVSAQNTVAVTGLECLSPGLVTLQLEAVFSDIGVNTVKIGLLGNPENARAAGAFLAGLSPRPDVVLDPVMVSASGYAFLDRESVEAVRELFPLATLVTPNIPEAEALTGLKIKTEDDYVRAGEKIMEMGAEQVLIKGGHSGGTKSDDLLIGPQGVHWFTVERVRTKNNHGTGCTLSSAVAACLARGEDLEGAVRLAKTYVAGAMEASVDLGRGPGPLNHFFPYYVYGKLS